MGFTARRTPGTIPRGSDYARWRFTSCPKPKGSGAVAQIEFIRRELIPGWRATVEAVAAERVYLGRITLPPHDPEAPFPLHHITNDWPMYCAVDHGEVVGWADITPDGIAECRHRGTLGMGLRAGHRGKGLGGQLLDACLAHAPRCGIEQVELAVYTTNTAAIGLYRSRGFTEYGLIRDWRRVDGRSDDSLLMVRRES